MKQMHNFRLPALLLGLFLLSAGLQVKAQYPSIPGNPTTFQNTNTPDPFGGTFYNGGTAVYTIPSNYNAYCADRSTPVCDGTKDALSAGTANTNSQLAYAMYLLNIKGSDFINTPYSDFVKRELIWAILGQTNTCSSNSDCSALLANVQNMSTSATLTFNITPSATTYNAGDKIRFAIETNLTEGLVYLGDFNDAALWEFCDASGNPISTPAGASINLTVVGTSYSSSYENALKITYPVTTTTTYYICTKAALVGKGQICYIPYKIPQAGNVSVWERAGCQTLVHLMPTEMGTQGNVEWGTCADIALTIERNHASNGGGSDTGSETTVGGQRVFLYNAGGTIQLMPSNVNTTNGCGPTSYQSTSVQWAGPNGFTSTQERPNAITNATASNAGVYTVSYQVGSCTPTATVSVVLCPVAATLTATPSSAQGIHTATQISQFAVATGANVSLDANLPSGATNVTLRILPPPNYNSGGSNNPVTLPFVISNFNSSNLGRYMLNYETTSGCAYNYSVILLLGAAPTANLSLQKTVSKVNPNAGENITYTVKVTNAGPDTATNVVLKDVLPAGLTFVSVNTGTYVAGTGLWTIGTVPVGTTTVTMTVTVN